MARMRPTRQAGFTLLELLMGAAVSTIVLMAVALSVSAVNSGYQQAGRVSASVENSRVAAAYLQRVLRYAGYGVPPKYAFDFTALTGATCTGSQAGDKANCTFTMTGQPSVTTDDLAFRFRDPGYMRRGKLGSTTLPATFTVESAAGGSDLGTTLKADQPVIVSCPGGTEFFIGRVNTAVTSSTSSTVSIKAYGGSPSPALDAAVSSPPACTTGANATGAGAAYLFLLYETRLRVVSLGSGATAQPYLVAFHNFGSVDPAANTDFDPIAAGVEDFEVEYLMNRVPCDSKCCSEASASPACGTGSASITPVDSSSSTKNWILGDDSGNTAQMVPSVNAATMADYSTPYDDPKRYNSNPNNIRALRLSASVRQFEALGSRQAIPATTLADHAVTGAKDGYYRSVFSTTVRLPNMASHSYFVPPIRTSVNDGDLDVWGG